MSSPASVLSRTLQSFTNTKVREIGKQRKWFESRKAKILQDVDSADGRQIRVRFLLTGLESLARSGVGLSKLWSTDSNESLLGNIRRYLDQSDYDSSISDAMLQRFERDLTTRLNQQSHQFDYADLYSRLLSEWLDPNASTIAKVSPTESGSLDGAFEVVEKDRLQQLRDKFSSVVFSPVITDEVEIETCVSGLFSKEGTARALNDIRSNLTEFGTSFWSRATPFDSDSLHWCIQTLLKKDLLNDQQKSILRDISDNAVVEDEIADVLNMRFVDLENWTWDAPEGMYYEPRRQLNGKYRIMMDEDILQAIFTHYIGTTWAVHFKRTFAVFVYDFSTWQGQERMPREERLRQEFYLGKDQVPPCGGVERTRQQIFHKHYFLTALPNSEKEGAGAYDDDDEDEDESSKSKSGKETRQQLLRQFATEIILHRSLHGEVVMVQSDLQWFAAGMPHSTILALLRFFGVPDAWLSWFKIFLEAPLRMSNEVGAEVRTRKRGTPMAHVLEMLLGEVVLFVMDIAVNQEAGINLYRLHDDFWLCGKPDRCAAAWKTMQRYGKLMGLDFNRRKTGSVYFTKDHHRDKEIVDTLPEGNVTVGLLKLDPDSCDWIIDQPQVDAHIKQLQKQLAECKSIFAWVQTWNSCIGRFFQESFGSPANCFGQKHVDSILQTHEKMQRELFNDGKGTGNSVTDYVKNLIEERTGVADVPDSFVFMPEELGGLGLRNPFIPFLAVRDEVPHDPYKFMDNFKEDEAKAYRTVKEDFEGLAERDKRKRYRSIYHDDYANASPSFGEFLSMEDFTRYREVSSSELKSIYKFLMLKPSTKNIDISDKVSSALSILGLEDLNLEKKWLIQLYSAELYERFGGLSIVEKRLLPLGVMTMLRNEKVTWQMVL
jgi:hypothetical protein